MSAVTELRVRYAETDQMGVAHHASYPVWFEVGRTEWLRSRGLSYAEIEASGYYLMLAALRVDYRRAARYDDVLRLETGVLEVKSRKLTFGYRLLREGALLASGLSEHFATDKAYRPVRLPQDVLNILTPA